MEREPTCRESAPARQIEFPMARNDPGPGGSCDQLLKAHLLLVVENVGDNSPVKSLRAEYRRFVILADGDETQRERDT